MPALPPPVRDAFAPHDGKDRRDPGSGRDPLEEHNTEPDLRRRLARLAAAAPAPEEELDEPTQDVPSLEGGIEEAVLFDELDAVGDGVPLVLARATQHPRALAPAPIPTPAPAAAPPPEPTFALDDLRRMPGYVGCVLVDSAGVVLLADGGLRGDPNLAEIGLAEAAAWRAIGDFTPEARVAEEIVVVTAERIAVSRPTDGGGVFVAQFSTDQANVALIQLALARGPTPPG